MEGNGGDMAPASHTLGSERLKTARIQIVQYILRGRYTDKKYKKINVKTDS